MEHRYAQTWRALAALVFCLAMLIAGCGEDSSTSAGTSASPTTEEQPADETGDGEETEDAGGEAAEKTKPKVSVPKSAPPPLLSVNDVEPGSGPEVKTGDEVTVHYVGVLYNSGKEFDASWDRGQPFTFKVGARKVIPGWEQGIVGMKAGGRRELVIPPGLAYGNQRVGSIAPNSTLVFVIDLLEVN